MPRVFDVVIEQDEDGWLVASVPELPGCHTQAKSQDELIERIREAIVLYLDTQDPTEPRSRFVGIRHVEVEV